MGKEPVNVLLLKKKNAQYEAAQHHAQKLLEATGRAKWFADDFQRLGRPELTAQTKDFVAKETSLIQRHKVSLRDQIAQELEAANAMVRMQRKARLRELLLRERLEYESALNGMGLAFEKCRD